jgi:hypothetical protein
MIYELTVEVPEPVLRSLMPNQVLEDKFREGYRVGFAKARGWAKPRGVHTVNASQGLVRAMARKSALHVRPFFLIADLHFRLFADWPCDDDAWLFLVKPCVDGMADALGWSKDRRRVGEISGEVVRERGAGLVVQIHSEASA